MALNYSTHVNTHKHTHQSERSDIRDVSVLMAEEHAWRGGMFAYLIFSRERENRRENRGKKPRGRSKGKSNSGRERENDRKNVKVQVRPTVSYDTKQCNLTNMTCI